MAKLIKNIDDFERIADHAVNLLESAEELESKAAKGHLAFENLTSNALGSDKAHRYKRVSLSVQKTNYAAKLYQNIGFKIVKENKEEYIMVNYL